MQPIRVYSDDLRLLTETDNYISLQFTPRFYEAGEFEIHINQYIEGAEHFQKGNYIVLDKQGDKAMVIRHREVSLDSNGKASENWKITGVTLDGILDQRVTIPPEHTSHDRKKGNAETVMKHYVERHFVNPDDPERKIDFLEIAPNKNRGSQIDWESRFSNVGEEITSISKLANIGWAIYADMERRKWLFDVIEPRDVTQDNPTGLQPVFFSPDYQTIKNQQFVDSNINYRNVGYVGGQGEGTERKIVKIGEAKGIHLHEVFIDARDVGGTLETEEGEEIELTPEEEEAILIERGEQKMKEFETMFYLEAQILTPSIRNVTNDFAMSTPFEYEVDFRLGDIVQVFNKTWNITMDAPITEIKEIHESGGFILEATFGEARPTLIQKIKRKFNELEGIENQELPAKLSIERMKEAIGIAGDLITEEERKRMEQALKNLEESKEYANEQAYQAEKQAKEDSARYTEGYAEKKRVESDIPPNDKSVIWIDISNPDNVIWKVWKDNQWIEGPGGPKGEPGPQGIQGPPGEKGQPTYTWIRYADTENGVGISNSSEGKDYIGIATNKLTETESNDRNDYNWSLIKGPKGEMGPQGIEGPAGDDGNPTYTWIKYADNAQGDGMSNYPDDKEYIGLAHNKTTPIESNNASDYTWAKLKGDPGEQGPKGEDGPQGIAGPPGEDGKSLYTWVKYADSPTSGMSDSPNGKKYIGIAYNKSTPTKSNFYSDYEWAKTEGNQGVPGEPGKDGTPRYTWVKYANDKNGNGMSDSAEGKRYLGLAHNKTSASESSNPDDYSWSPLYDNVKVGGVNLISGSATPLNYGVASSSHDYKRVYLNLERNTTYTFSSKVEVIQGDVTEITVYPYKQSGQNMSTMHLPIIDGKIEGTFTTDDRYDYDLLVYNGKSGNTTGNHIKLIERQLERGNIRSDYDRSPEDVNKDINDAEDNAKGHADTVSEAAYIDAINDAEDYMEANGIMQGAKYNGVSITNEDGFVTARGDGLVRTVMNSTLGYVVQRRSSKSAPWENVLFFDTNGNARFAGTITADSTIDVETDATIGGYLTVGKNITDRYVGITFGDGDENASISTQVTPEGNSNGLDFYADYVNIAKPGGRFMADEFRTRDGIVDAIVSQGSNANGEFVRYESGLQLCWAQPFAQATNSRYSDTSITTSSTDYWTYPADFDDDYPIAVSGVCSSLSRIVGTTGSTSNGSAPIRTYSLSGAYTNTAYSVYTMAIGRWK